MVRERVLEEVRGLLQELGSAGAMPMLKGSSHLERDLGLGSLERVELMARLEKVFGVRIVDQAAAQANTPDDLATGGFEGPKSAPEKQRGSAFRASLQDPLCAPLRTSRHASGTTQKLHRETEEMGVLTAEPLVDVLRYRAAHDAERTHLAITEDAEGQGKNVTLTFGELYAAAQRCAAEFTR